MAKVKIKAKDGIFEVRSKLNKDEYINEKPILKFTSTRFRR